MSEGHPDAGADEERDTDLGDMTDDGEVELNLPREDAVEQDPPGEDVRDQPGSPAYGDVGDKSGGTVSVGAP